jgi:hypothetical protein
MNQLIQTPFIALLIIGLITISPQSSAQSTTDSTAQDSIDYIPKIFTGDISYLSVCPGSTVEIPFRTEGDFDSDNLFQAQLLDAAGNVFPISPYVKGGPIKAIIPSDKKGGHLYSIRIVGSSPKVTGTSQTFRLLESPTAQILSADGYNSTRIMPGQQAQLKVNFTGHGPWSFQLSDSINISQTFSNPYYFSVAPRQITSYSITGVANACGNGSAKGNVIVNVDPNPAPRIALNESENGFKVCNGIPFQVAFSATGLFKQGNNFTVQIADKSGDFKSISTSDTLSPLVATIPAGIIPGKYKLRVTSTEPVVFSEEAEVTIASPAVITLKGDSVRIKDGESAFLNFDLKGGGPWFVLLSDGTFENYISSSTHKIEVKPKYTTTYKINSAGGMCGVGQFSGSVTVHVQSPPPSIAMESPVQSTICAGGEIEIPLNTTGRFNSNNKFVVQMADKKGNFKNLQTTLEKGILKARISSAAQNDSVSSQSIRIVSTSPAINSPERQIKVIAANAATAEISGNAIIAKGGYTRVRLRFTNGLPPWSFTLSDGTSVSGTFMNPYLITVAPENTHEFTVKSVTNACGTGAGKGSAIIKVE